VEASTALADHLFAELNHGQLPVRATLAPHRPTATGSTAAGRRRSRHGRLDAALELYRGNAGQYQTAAEGARALAEQDKYHFQYSNTPSECTNANGTSLLCLDPAVSG
jgi:hypothetical protein